MQESVENWQALISGTYAKKVENTSFGQKTNVSYQIKQFVK